MSAEIPSYTGLIGEVLSTSQHRPDEDNKNGTRIKEDQLQGKARGFTFAHLGVEQRKG